MHVNKLYGLSSAVIDIFPQGNARAAVEKMPLRSPTPEQTSSYSSQLGFGSLGSRWQHSPSQIF